MRAAGCGAPDPNPGGRTRGAGQVPHEEGGVASGRLRPQRGFKSQEGGRRRLQPLPGARERAAARAQPWPCGQGPRGGSAASCSSLCSLPAPPRSAGNSRSPAARPARSECTRGATSGPPVSLRTRKATLTIPSTPFSSPAAAQPQTLASRLVGTVELI